jgi:catechol 2,3-dioxygenase-like lactoylglutathione lyase family enzyme
MVDTCAVFERRVRRVVCGDDTVKGKRQSRSRANRVNQIDSFATVIAISNKRRNLTFIGMIIVQRGHEIPPSSRSGGRTERRNRVGLRHIAIVSIPVSDQESAKDFYVNTLRFELVSDSVFGDQRWIEVKPSGTDTAVTLVNWFPTMPAGSLKGIVLACDNADESYEDLKAKGVNFQSTPETAFWGRFATFDDPDGNGWVLTSAVAEK